MIYWKRQNFLQKYGRPIYEFFKHTKTGYHLPTYDPKLSRKRLVLGTIFIGICISTPCTDFMIPAATRWMVK